MDLKTPEIILLFRGTKAVMHETFLKAMIKYDFSLKLLDLAQPIQIDVPMSLILHLSHAH